MSDWRLAAYDLPLGPEPLDLPGAAWFVYMLSGAARVGDTAVGAGEGAVVTGPCRVGGEGLAWAFEAAPASTPFPSGLTLVLARPVGPLADRMFRADRIRMRPDTVTPRHGHRGPGIRRVLSGAILGAIGEGHDRLDPGRAWYETGTDPVVGTNLHPDGSAFVRAMLLPRELAGGATSFVPWDPSEALKSRAVQNDLLGECLPEKNAHGGDE